MKKNMFVSFLKKTGISSAQGQRFFVLVTLVLFGFIIGSKQTEVQVWLKNPSFNFSQSQDTVTPKQLKNMLQKKNFTFINVHTPYEGEIEKTDSFIAYNEIVASTASLPKDKNAPIILYCKTGRMSSEAIGTIKKLGYTNVRHLAGGMDAWQKTKGTIADLSSLEQEVLPAEGKELPIAWGDLGPELIRLGVIDLAKFKEAVTLTPEQETILTEGSKANIRIDGKNSQFVVDLLWAIGLAQKSIVYEKGPLGTEYKNEAGNFASTGGWTLAKGEATKYLNKYDLIPLSSEQQELVGNIAKNVYRPCCGNSTWFPDCNHGMAALAAIELMVAAGIDEASIYQHVLALNSYWFPDSYLYVATYFARQGTAWKNVDAKMVLGENYSSAKGASDIARKVGQLPYRPQKSGGSCGA